MTILEFVIAFAIVWLVVSVIAGFLIARVIGTMGR